MSEATTEPEVVKELTKEDVLKAVEAKAPLTPNVSPAREAWAKQVGNVLLQRERQELGLPPLTMDDFDKSLTGRVEGGENLTQAQKDAMIANLRAVGVSEETIAKASGTAPDTSTDPAKIAADAEAAREHLAMQAELKANAPATGSDQYQGTMEQSTREALFKGSLSPVAGTELAAALDASAKLWAGMTEASKLEYIAETDAKLGRELSEGDRAKMMAHARAALTTMGVTKDHALMAGGALNSAEVFRLLAAHGARLAARAKK